jgi:hypothetical protein
MDIQVIRHRHTGMSITGRRITIAARGVMVIGVGTILTAGGGDTAIIGDKVSLIDRIKNG